MFKRLMIGLVAVGLVTLFIAESANARAIRYRRTVENFHSCQEYIPGSETPDLCYGAETVTDTLYGYEADEATCIMTGRVICDAPPTEELCSFGVEPAHLDVNSFSASATFDPTDATNETLLSTEDGQAICDATYPGQGTVFVNYWPYVFMVHSHYESITGFPNIGEGSHTYELVEHCTFDPDSGSDEYVCTKIWDSLSQDDPPHFPCCGEVNTLTVEITEGGGGVVTSEPSGINCPDGDCSETYGTGPGDDGCPLVVLTATPDPNIIYDFAGWSGDGCSGTDPCTTSAKNDPTVTATFVPTSLYFLKVEVIGDGKKDRAWIFKPRSDFDYPEGFYCKGTCYKIFEPGTMVTIKRKGGTFGSWGGACEGLPNSADTCTVEIDGSQESVIVNFIN